MRARILWCLAIVLPGFAAAQETRSMETQPDAVMIAEAAFYENLIPVDHAVGAPPALSLFRFEITEIDLYEADRMWRWTEEYSAGTLTGAKTYEGLVEYGLYAVDPADLTIPVEVEFIGFGISEDADVWQIGVVCADGADCVEGTVRSEEGQSGYLDELWVEFRANPAGEVDMRAANYWWIEGEVEARRVAEALNVMLAHAGAQPRDYE